MYPTKRWGVVKHCEQVWEPGQLTRVAGLQALIVKCDSIEPEVIKYWHCEIEQRDGSKHSIDWMGWQCMVDQDDSDAVTVTNDGLSHNSQVDQD